MVKKEDSILGGILKYSISTWANLFIGFLSVILTTRILLPETYGRISLFLSATSVGVYFFTVGLDGAYIRFFNDSLADNTRFQLLYKNLVIITGLMLVIGGIVLLFFADSLSNALFDINSQLIILMFFLYTYCCIVLRFLNINYRMSFNVKMYNIQNVMLACFGKLMIIIAAFFTKDFFIIVTVLTLGICLLLSVYLTIQRKEFIPVDLNGKINISLDFKGCWVYFRFALYSAPAYIITYANVYLSQQIISSKMGAYALGIFSSAGIFSTILSAVQGGFSTYWSAYVYKNYRNEQEKIARMHNYVLLSAILIISALVLGRDVIYLFIGEDYRASKMFFSLLLLMPILSFVLETTDKGIVLSNKNEILFFITVVTVAVNIIGCIILINYFGVKGAACASALSALVRYILNTLWGQKYYKSISNYSKSIISILIIIVLSVIPSIIYSFWPILIAVLIVDLIALLVLNSEYKYLFNILLAFTRR